MITIKNKKKLIVIILLSLLLIITSLLVVTNNIDWYDNFIKNLITQNDIIISIFKIITLFGDWFILIPISIILFIILKEKRYSIYIIVNLILSSGVNTLLKIIFSRPRPENMLVDETSFSYPSGHTFVSLAFYGFLIYLITKSNLTKNKKNILNIALIILIILIGTSRVYLNAHYPSDIAGALLAGTIYLLGYIKVIETVEGDKNDKKEKRKK